MRGYLSLTALGVAAILTGAPPQKLAVAPSGNEARYRVREQLVNVSFPSDAVGATQNVTGAIVIGNDGKIDSSQSKIVVDLTTLKSDRERRDGFVGTAKTHFAFETFGVEQPRVMVVLSVENDIRLEYDFHLVKAP